MWGVQGVVIDRNLVEVVDPLIYVDNPYNDAFHHCLVMCDSLV